ncbi:MAG: hypothetical protein HKO59_10745 [Phycisphaerales bacterium]|nr:hypothetical protein [Phycisphaerales bacterium]
MTPHPLVAGAARAVAGLAPAVRRLLCDDAILRDTKAAADRGYFTPDEDERVRSWFARYLTARSELSETIRDLRPLAQPRRDGEIRDATRMQAFIVAYAAACTLVNAGRGLVREIAHHTVVQRKLNEQHAGQRIPRKQYTAVYRSLTSPRHAWQLAQAIELADTNRDAIDAAAADPILAPVVDVIESNESVLRMGVRQYLRARLRYRWHSYRRRRASAAQQGLFHLAAASGRVIAEMRLPWHRDRLRRAHRAHLASLVRPGDVFVVRHDRVMSNLFLPGYWPHVALYVGSAADRATHAIEVDEACAAAWVDPHCVLEARKDGVLFRPLDDTLAVDAVVVLRPSLAAADVAAAIARAATHHGKLYNFDFDFFTADRLVCTEVVYRAYEGIGGVTFPLQTRAGRLTLSAEDILDLAVANRGFETVAVFGTPHVGNRVVTGADAAHALAASYQAGRS